MYSSGQESAVEVDIILLTPLMDFEISCSRITWAEELENAVQAPRICTAAHINRRLFLNSWAPEVYTDSKIATIFLKSPRVHHKSQTLC